jgi:hypothetical protein
MEDRVEDCTKTLEVHDEVKEVDGEVEDVDVQTYEAEQAGEYMVDDHLQRERGREGGREREREGGRERICTDLLPMLRVSHSLNIRLRKYFTLKNICHAKFCVFNFYRGRLSTKIYDILSLTLENYYSILPRPSL